MKFVSVALIFAASLASTGAVVFPRDDALAGYTKRAVPCNAQQPWQVNLAVSVTLHIILVRSRHWQYTAGQQVIFNNSLWTANQWSYNSPPGNPAAAWTLVDVCSPLPPNPVICTGISSWNAATAYLRGDEVTFNNHLWAAVQWTYSNSPGDASGSWRDEGAC
jgi:hypothetical protein